MPFPVRNANDLCVIYFSSNEGFPLLKFLLTKFVIGIYISRCYATCFLFCFFCQVLTVTLKLKQIIMYEWF